MKLKVLIITMLAVCLCAPAFTFAEQQQASATVVKIGDITSINGDVMIRSKGVWMTVGTVPFPVFNSDKIVTGVGRAEVRFPGGTAVRLDQDSNVRIESSQKTVGLFSKKTIVTRNIKVLVGNVWFNVKPEEGKEFNFVTPTMSAMITGTEGQFKVGAKGLSSYGLKLGSAKTSGNFSPMKAESLNLMTTLAPSNEEIKTSPAMKAAYAALAGQQKAKDSKTASSTSKATAMKLKTDLKQITTDEAKTTAAKAIIQSVTDSGNHLLASSEADLASAQEVLAEAEAMNDTKGISNAKANLMRAEGAFKNVQMINAETVSLAEKSGMAENPALAVALAAVAEASVESLKATAAISSAINQLSIAQTASDNVMATQVAEQVLTALSQIADDTRQKAANAQQIVANAETSGDMAVIEIAEAAALAISSAAAANASHAVAQTNIAGEMTAGDTASYQVAVTVATQAGQMSQTANTAYTNIVTAVSEGNITNVQTATQVVDTAAEQAATMEVVALPAGEAVAAPAPVTAEPAVTAPAEDVVVVVPPTTVVVPTDTKDLPSASPSK